MFDIVVSKTGREDGFASEGFRHGNDFGAVYHLRAVLAEDSKLRHCGPEFGLHLRLVVYKEINMLNKTSIAYSCTY